MKERIYLPGLNGLRVIAAMAVVITHINNRLDYFGLPKAPLLDLASYGVTVFFTLSGFLITYLLLKEFELTGTINMKKFYMRRILRIWPLYYLYLFIVILLNGIANIQWPILFYVLIVPNFKNSFVGLINTSVGNKIMTFMIGHYWSLGVEEQFYAFWPWIVKKSNKIFQFLILFPIAFVLLKLILRIFHAPYNILVFVNYTRFGCLVIGGLGAYLYFKNSQKLKIINNRWIEFLAWVFFVIVATNKFHITSIIDHEIIAFFTLIIIFNQINNPDKLISLENKVFDYLGKISFGLYVYNPLVIYLMALIFNYFVIENQIIKLLLIYLLVIPAIILVAHLSYHYFEKRFLKLKSNYTTIQSAASKSENLL
ncbi:acyltransferase family protein [Flavobacterium lacustre]|uniref:acyltransferase family protein n=1 Tax=Flavobacterium lacustre TaxID=3016339 RepID=UPI0022B6DB66|nr:acyltransferase [Flavobacterium lacustre]